MRNAPQGRANYLKTLEMLAKSRISIAVHADNLRSIIERPEASDDHRERAARLLVAATA